MLVSIVAPKCHPEIIPPSSFYSWASPSQEFSGEALNSNVMAKRQRLAKLCIVQTKLKVPPPHLDCFIQNWLHNVPDPWESRLAMRAFLTFWKEVGWCPVFRSSFPDLVKLEGALIGTWDTSLPFPTAKLWIFKPVSWSFGSGSCFPNEDCFPTPWACPDLVIQPNLFPVLKWVISGLHSSLGPQRRIDGTV